MIAVVTVLAVAAGIFWLTSSSKGGETADVIAGQEEARGCTNTKVEDATAEDLSDGLAPTGEMADEIVAISCDPFQDSPTIYLLRFETPVDAGDVTGDKAVCLLDNEIVASGPGSSHATLEACRELDGAWLERPRFGGYPTS